MSDSVHGRQPTKLSHPWDSPGKNTGARKLRPSSHSDLCDLTLLKPLWQLFTQMEYSLFEDVTQAGILLPLHRAPSKQVRTLRRQSFLPGGWTVGLMLS